MVSKILIELPAKSLMRFRCVSKTWLSIVNDPYFVSSHHDRSHTRPGGINLIVCREVFEDPWGPGEPIYNVFSTDPQGKSPLKHLTLPAVVPREYNLDNLHSVRGLVCVGKCIWNPTINESIVLPSFSLPQINCTEVDCEIRHCEEYALGFDSSNKAYKVLGGLHSFRVRSLKKFGCKYFEERQTQLKILDLGGSTWRDIESLPSDHEFQERIFLGIRNSCCIDNLLFVRRDCSALAAFDFRSEKFEVIPVPDDLTYKYDMPMIQVGECVALINEEIDTMWILEDYKKHLWKSESLVIGPLKEVIKLKSKIEFIRITPVGEIHTSNEILLYIRADNKQYFYSYNINTKTYRIVRKLTRKIRGIRDPELIADHYDAYVYLKKHVESVYRLV